MKALSRVLCAVDIDEPGRAAFAQALALARVHDAKLLLVCAVPSNQPFNWQANALSIIGTPPCLTPQNDAGCLTNVKLISQFKALAAFAEDCC